VFGLDEEDVEVLLIQPREGHAWQDRRSGFVASPAVRVATLPQTTDDRIQIVIGQLHLLHPGLQGHRGFGLLVLGIFLAHGLPLSLMALGGCEGLDDPGVDRDGRSTYSRLACLMAGKEKAQQPGEIAGLLNVEAAGAGFG
jgi:hypothetical protein